MDEVTLFTLGEVLQLERRSGMLSRLPGDFFAKARRAVDMSEGEEAERGRMALRDLIFLRQRKVVLMAASAASGADVSTKNMTIDERDLFRSVKNALEMHARQVLSLQMQSRLSRDLVIVRAKEDLHPFVSMERTYYVGKDDVLTVPPGVAEILGRGGKVHRILERDDVGVEC